MALTIAAQAPTLFSTVGGHSPAVTDPSAVATALTKGGQRVWLDAGAAKALLRTARPKQWVKNGLVLAASHDILGWTGTLADNLSASVIGMGLATALRFWGFRHLDFHDATPESAPQCAHPLGRGAQ